jgi:ABC-type phosphate transport system substrate-binding protein
MTPCSQSSLPSHRINRFALLALATTLASDAVATADAGRSDDVVVVVVAAAKSPISTLTKSELADLFLGRVTRFPDGRLAVPIDQRDDSPAYAEFYSVFVGRTAAQVKAHWSKIIFTGRGSPPRAVADGEQLRRRVAGDSSTIGYLERRLVDASLQIVRIE